MAMLKTRTNWLTPKNARSTVIWRVGVQPRIEKPASQLADQVLLLVDFGAAASREKGEDAKRRRRIR